MSVVEAVLQVRPGEGEGALLLGRTDDPRVVRVLQARLLEEASEDADKWESIDPIVASIKMADADRLRRVLSSLLPEESD